ncbi:serine/threonine-protein kinase [Lentzea nigeriaca]|uniref:serine/threonine-protein kinase n=1 Tax=Lentzea nigeriaca TaxID=1128665 RepID=UPI00195868CA|nr:serine/threonine-protein kinase [Lentzea nigeriaca]MBM7864285.1 serine/threonine protein kinase [Lentzea nigeriaca]
MSVSAEDRLIAERYELAELLGSGAMADVRRAWDTRLQRHVAVKLFRAGSDVADVLRFDNEVKTLAALSHPGLVQVHDAGTTAGTPFVVLQIVDGCTLRDRITHGPLEVDDVRRLGAELADALAYVHAHGVVHRDIKPSNILLDRDGNAHLADFGLARLIGTTRLTRTDQLVGTAAYLAPEQVRGEEFGHPVDVYALGLVLLECLTGRREYEGSEIEAAVARLHRQPIVPDELPADLKRLLTLMTSLSPRRRPTATECAQALRDTGDAPTRVGAPVHPRRPIRLLVASVLLAALGAAGVTATVLSPPPPGESAPPATTTLVAPTTSTPAPATGSAQPQSNPAVVVPAQVNPPADDKVGGKKGEEDKPRKPDKDRKDSDKG